jgi:hypothetical protein
LKRLQISFHLTLINVESSLDDRRAFTSPQNYWVFGLFPSSGILGTTKYDVSETGSVSILRCGEGRHLSTLITGPVIEVGCV